MADVDQRQAVEHARQQSVEDLRWVMSTPQGRRFMNGLLAEAGIYRSSFAADPYVTAFSEGERNSGVRLLARLLSETPEQYFVMIQENISGRS